MPGCCRNCSIEVYGEDLGDFTGMIGSALVAEGYGLVVDCEFCGTAIVDDDGSRVPQILCDA